jgi:hypothetical protein
MVVAQGGAPERALSGLAAEAATLTPGTRGSYRALVQHRQTVRPCRSYFRVLYSIRRLLWRLCPRLARGVVSWRWCNTVEPSVLVDPTTAFRVAQGAAASAITLHNTPEESF